MCVITNAITRKRSMSQVSPVADDVPHIRSPIFSHKHHNYVSVFCFSFTIMHSHSWCLFRVRFDSIATRRDRCWSPNFCIVFYFIFISFGSFISIPINVHLFSSTFTSKFHYANSMVRMDCILCKLRNEQRRDDE